MKREKLDMYVAPQDYILDAVKDPINLDVEQDIIGEIENFDSIEPTVFDKFIIKASPVEEHIKESKKNESDDEFEDDEDFDRDLTNDELEVGKTYALILNRGQEWIIGNIEDDIDLYSEDEIKRLKDAGWVDEVGDIIVPDEESFVFKAKGKYGDTLYFPSVDITFDGLVGGDDDLYYRVESLKKKNEDLPESQEYEFELRQDGVDKYTAISGESEYSIFVADTETLNEAIRDFIDCEFIYDLDDSENIQSSELTFLDFDDEEGTGKFKATIFWGLNESLRKNEEDFNKKALLEECEKEFNELVKDAASITWQGPKFIDYTLLCIHCEDFEALNALEAADLIEDLGFVVDRSYDDEPVFALDKSMSKEDLKLEIEKDAKANGYDIPYNDESKNEDFVSPAEENRLKLYYTDMTKDNTSTEAADKTVEFAKYAFPQLSEYTVRKIAAETYLDICIDRYFEQNPDTEEIPQDKYDEFIADAEKMADSKLSARYYESKNERGGSDYGSFYNMFADRLQEEGYEGLKKIAWYCDLGTEFSGIANAIREFRDEDYKAINKRAFKIFSAIDSLVVSYWDSIQGAALYFDSLGKQDNRFDNMLTDMLEDYSLGTPNIGSPNSIRDLVDDIVAELPKAIEMSNKGLNALYRIIDSITAPQGAIGTKKAIKVQLKAALDKEIAKANRIVALLKQEWPEGIQPQKDMFKGPQDANKLEYEIHAILGEEMYSNTLSDDFGSFFIEDANDSANGICVNFYFGQPEGKVRVIASANPEQYGNDYIEEAVYKLPIDVNELAQNAIYLHNEAIKSMQEDLTNESLIPAMIPEKPSTVLNDSKFYIVQVLGKDGKWKTICKSLDEEYAYEIYDRWNERIESGDTSLATDISFSDPQELMYEAMEDFTYGK